MTGKNSEDFLPRSDVRTGECLAKSPIIGPFIMQQWVQDVPSRLVGSPWWSLGNHDKPHNLNLGCIPVPGGLSVVVDLLQSLEVVGNSLGSEERTQVGQPARELYL
nr:hypothetical protein [Desulfobacula sp.]